MSCGQRILIAVIVMNMSPLKRHVGKLLALALTLAAEARAANDPPPTLYQLGSEIKRELGEVQDLKQLLDVAERWDNAFSAQVQKAKASPYLSERDKIAAYFFEKIKDHLNDAFMEKLAPELAELISRVPRSVSLAWAALEVSKPSYVRDTAGELVDLDRGIQQQIQAKLTALLPKPIMSIVTSVNHDYAKDRASISAVQARPTANNSGLSLSQSKMDCSILSDPAKSQALLQSDPEAWQRLVEECEKNKRHSSDVP